MKTIGFFGDSYCAINDDTSRFAEDYSWLTTYISLVSKKYNLEVVNLGIPGSSIYDCLLLQFKSFMKNNKLPDICVFVWTDPNRLFHRTTRKINYGTARMSTELEGEWLAARQYYEHLHDDEVAELQYVSVLHYYDNFIFSNIVDDTKIIHLWGMGKATKLTNKTDPISSEQVDYYYRWKNGMEIRPSLATLSRVFYDTAPNHIGTQEKNNLACEWISAAIDNYENGKLLEF